MSQDGKWLVDGVPAFVVVGKINMGKSSVLATLLEIDDDSLVRISSMPVTTTRCQVLSLTIGGEEKLRFIDSPGFARALDAMREIQAVKGEGSPSLSDVRQFVEEQRGSGEYEDECRLLEPVIEGAGILYVVDSSKPLRSAAVAEMEILRWTGRPRMALLNPRAETEGNYEEEWRERLGSYFNLTRTFNAHEARFTDRRNLLESLVQIDERHREIITETLNLLEMEWENRQDEVARVVLRFLEKAIQLRAKEEVSGSTLEDEKAKSKKLGELTEAYRRSLHKLESKTTKKLLEIYQHGGVDEGDGNSFEQIDLMSADTWSKWGLSRNQLVIAGGVAGAAAGSTIDLGSGGLSHGAGTIFGGLGGAALAFFKGGALPELRLDLDKGLHFSSKNGRMLTVGPPESINFPFILLDGMLHRYREILSRTHGQRDRSAIAVAQGQSYTQEFSSARRRALAKWFSTLSKDKRDEDERDAAFAEIHASVEEVAASLMVKS